MSLAISWRLSLLMPQRADSINVRTDHMLPPHQELGDICSLQQYEFLGLYDKPPASSSQRVDLSLVQLGLVRVHLCLSLIASEASLCLVTFYTSYISLWAELREQTSW